VEKESLFLRHRDCRRPALRYDASGLGENMPEYPGVDGATTPTVALPVALYPGDSVLLWNAEHVQPSVAEASIAFTLPQATGVGTLAAVVFELLFGGAPGSFEMDIQEADTDADAFYIMPTPAAYKITAVNANQIARSDILTWGGRFGRVYFPTLTNDVLVTVRATRVA
jgi:hypothetical protein